MVSKVSIMNEKTQLLAMIAGLNRGLLATPGRPHEDFNSH